MLMRKTQLESKMREAAGTNHHTLVQYLKCHGIQPGPFAYFLSQYIKRKPEAKRSVLSVLLSAQLQAQAELIAYHLAN